LKERTKELLRVLSRTLQAAPTPEFANVFCFFSSETKTFLSSLRRQINTAFRISVWCTKMERRAGQILSAAFICLHHISGAQTSAWEKP
jgi:hypothetical protein